MLHRLLISDLTREEWNHCKLIIFVHFVQTESFVQLPIVLCILCCPLWSFVHLFSCYRSLGTLKTASSVMLSFIDHCCFYDLTLCMKRDQQKQTSLRTKMGPDSQKIKVLFYSFNASNSPVAFKILLEWLFESFCYFLWFSNSWQQFLKLFKCDILWHALFLSICLYISVYFCAFVGRSTLNLMF